MDKGLVKSASGARIGLHLGDVVEESDGDLMGDGVNIAARLEGGSIRHALHAYAVQVAPTASSLARMRHGGGPDQNGGFEGAPSGEHGDRPRAEAERPPYCVVRRDWGTLLFSRANAKTDDPEDRAYDDAHPYTAGPAVRLFFADFVRAAALADGLLGGNAARAREANAHYQTHRQGAICAVTAITANQLRMSCYKN